MLEAHLPAHHQHTPGDNHNHSHPRDSKKPLLVAFALTSSYAVIELIGGWVSGSLALLSDAGHMATDATSLLLALFTYLLARKPANQRASYGYVRAEVLGAFVNALAMFVLIVWLGATAVQRLLDPLPIKGVLVTGIASIGLIVNLFVAWILSRGSKHFSTQGALLHVLGDLLGSLAAVAAGILVTFTGWLAIDPLLSLLVSALLLVSTWKLLRETIAVLMETVPAGIAYNEVELTLKTLPEIEQVYDLHIWRMGSYENALSAHVAIQSPENWPALARQIDHLLAGRFGIQHSTIQPHWHTTLSGDSDTVYQNTPYLCHFQPR